MRFWGIDTDRDRSGIQSLRASPPGLAAGDRARRRVFGAALEQFDELWQAAGTVGPPVSPIPLFYAMAQGSRAVTAVHIRDGDWQASGHGLSVRAPSNTIGELTIEPHDGSSHSFGAFCRAIGSSQLTSSARLTDVWAAVPGLERVDGLGADSNPALQLDAIASTPGNPATNALLRGDLAAGLPDDAEEAARTLAERLNEYPGVSDGFCVEPPVPRDPDPYRPQDGPSVEIYWRADDGTVRPLDSVAARLGGENTGNFILPALGANRDQLTPFAASWAVLLALSSAARYHPDRWVAALDRDKSVLAIPIEEALARTRESLPWLMLHALKGTL
jgi:hypothetical protein